MAVTMRALGAVVVAASLLLLLYQVHGGLTHMHVETQTTHIAHTTAAAVAERTPAVAPVVVNEDTALLVKLLKNDMKRQESIVDELRSLRDLAVHNGQQLDSLMQRGGLTDVISIENLRVTPRPVRPKKVFLDKASLLSSRQRPQRPPRTPRPPAPHELLFDSPSKHRDWHRAVVMYFGPVKPDVYAKEIRTFWESWLYVTYNGTLKVDFIIFHHPDVVGSLPDDMHCVPVGERLRDRGQCVRVAYTPPAGPFLDKDYGVASSVVFLGAPESEFLEEYELVLRSDTDTFLAPGFRYFFPKTMVVSHGGYTNHETLKRLKACARRLGIRHRGVHNTGSSWAGPGWQVREIGRLAYKYTEWVYYRGDWDNLGAALSNSSAELSDDELVEITSLSKTDGLWPNWYRRVSLLYGSEMALNEMFPRLRQFHPMIDVPTGCSSVDVEEVAHLHIYQGSDFFSKAMWGAGHYRDINMTGLNLHRPCYYALEMSLRAAGLRSGPLSLALPPGVSERKAPADRTVLALIQLRKESSRIYSAQGKLQHVASERCVDATNRVALAERLPDDHDAVMGSCTLTPNFRYDRNTSSISWFSQRTAKSYCLDAWVGKIPRLYKCTNEGGNQAWSLREPTGRTKQRAEAPSGEANTPGNEAPPKQFLIVTETDGTCVTVDTSTGGSTLVKVPCFGTTPRAKLLWQLMSDDAWLKKPKKAEEGKTPSSLQPGAALFAKKLQLSD